MAFWQVSDPRKLRITTVRVLPISHLVSIEGLSNTELQRGFKPNRFSDVNHQRGTIVHNSRNLANVMEKSNSRVLIQAPSNRPSTSKYYNLFSTTLMIPRLAFILLNVMLTRKHILRRIQAQLQRTHEYLEQEFAT